MAGSVPSTAGAPKGHLEFSVGNEHFGGGWWVVYFSFDPSTETWTVPNMKECGVRKWGRHELAEALSLSPLGHLDSQDVAALLEALSDPTGILSVLDVMGS